MPARNFSTTDEVNSTVPSPTPVGLAAGFLDAGKGTTDQEAQALVESQAIQTDLSESFLSARGTFYRVPLRSGTGPGLYAVEGLSQFISNARQDRTETLRRLKFNSNFASPQEITPDMDDEEIRARQDFNETIDSENARRSDQDRITATDKNTLASTPVLIMGISITQSDIVSAVSCLNNIKVFYTFGQQFGNVQIRGEMLLGPLGSIQSDGVRILAEFFNQQRVSNLKKTTTFSIAQTAYQMYLTGLTIGEVDVEFHVLPFVMVGTLLDPANQDASLLNPANQVIVTDDITTLSTSSISTGAAAAAQANQAAASGTTDSATLIKDFLATDEATAPSYNINDLSPYDQGRVRAANQAVVDAEQSGDFGYVMTAVQNRNEIVQSSIAKPNVGQQTPDGGRVQSAIKEVSSSQRLPTAEEAAETDRLQRVQAAKRNLASLSKPGTLGSKGLPDRTVAAPKGTGIVLPSSL